MKTKTYTKGNTTVVWDADKCIHSENCFRGLPEVFDPKVRPWINMDGATEEAIRNQVAKCPSGALSIKDAETSNTNNMSDVKIKVNQGGPLLVSGPCTIELSNGDSKTVEKSAALCRCGASQNKPFCDGSHKTVEFDK
ncbi:(4Fe-4S)-binding protein [Marinigracilibium pacificum]|uniref:Iron-binding zinc finger CDGSH type domain-containing protein n=1 Tax=Marinigracilibium pacificum TaxID=2729599 RepID=A0A848IXI1_9BACT|nr:(4Fe-4S)-binding protein [Marinigracilibium pacificum]NMM49007.1 hypothetical protein [Marinigracilibium pacificum]